MKAGDALPSVTKLVTQQGVNDYARASGDFNPLHLDAEFAAKSSYGRRVVHGMFVLAYVSEMMTLAFGRPWLESGRLKVRFRAPVYPESEVTTFGTVLEVLPDGDQVRLECSVGCRNQDGEEVISGTASVALPGQCAEESG